MIAKLIDPYLIVGPLLNMLTNMNMANMNIISGKYELSFMMFFQFSFYLTIL